MTAMRAAAGLAATLMVLAPAGAQTGDEQTGDHERRDRRYLERLAQAERDEPAADPEDERRRQRDAFLARAEELIRDRNYDSASSEHYRVQTDDPRLDPELAAGLLESFLAHFEATWSPRLDLGPAEGTRSRVFLFYSFYKYNQLLAGDFSRHTIRPKGHYVRALDVVAAHTGADTPRQLPDALIHEAAHQLVDQRLYGGEYLPSLWVTEGLASYFGYTYRDKRGAFEPGRIGGKSVRLIRDVAPGQSLEGKQRLRRFRAWLRGNDEGARELVERMVYSQDPAAFYGRTVDLHYSASWLLVHFLLHGEDGRHAEAFVRYLALEREGRGGPRVLYDTLGLTSGELAAAFVAHVRRLKAG